MNNLEVEVNNNKRTSSGNGNGQNMTIEQIDFTNIIQPQVLKSSSPRTSTSQYNIDIKEKNRLLENSPDSDAKPPSLVGGTNEWEEKQSFWKRAKEMKSRSSYFIMTILGSLLLISPALILILYDRGNIPGIKEILLILDLNNRDVDYLNNTLQQVVRWSFMLTSTWLIYIHAYFGFQNLPYILEKAVIWNYGYCSEKVLRRLEIVPALFQQLVNIFTAFWVIILYQIVFSNYRLVEHQVLILNIIATVLVLCCCLLVQRSVVHTIVINFNQVSMKQRVEISQKEVKIVEKLRKAVRSFAFLDLGEIVTETVMTGLVNLVPNSNSADSGSSKPDFLYSGPLSSIRIRSAHSVAQKDPEIAKHQNDHKNQNELEKEKKKIPPSFSISGPDSKNDIVVMIPNTSPLGSDSNIHKDELPKRHSGNDLTKQNFGASTTEKPEKSTLTQVQVGGVKKKSRKGLENSEHKEAHTLVRRLWSCLKAKHNQELSLPSFLPLFDNPDDAKAAFKLLDSDHSGTVTYDEIRGVIARVYQEKKDLNSGLNDLSHALGHLNMLLYSCTAFATILISLPIFGISFNSVLPFTSFIIALSFIFGGSAKQTFECIVFLFVLHPYDSGDRILVDDTVFVVVELSLLTTILLKDGQLTYYPNSILASKYIVNVRRSGDLVDRIKIAIPFEVKEEKLKELHKAMNSFCRSLPTRLNSTTNMQLLEIGSANVYQFTIEYKGNWQDSAARFQTRNSFLSELKNTLMKMDIVPQELNNPKK